MPNVSRNETNIRKMESRLKASSSEGLISLIKLLL